MSDHPNKIQRLQLENFTCFERADLEFSSGINVFIGENGTGKTHLLKVMYISLRQEKFTFLKELDDFHKLFGINEMGELIKYASKFREWRTKLNCGNSNPYKDSEHNLEIEFNYEESEKIEGTKTFPLESYYGSGDVYNPLYLPVMEMLSWSQGFVNLYRRKEINLDLTYHDLAFFLDDPFDRGKKNSNLITEVGKIFNIEVYKRNEVFFVKDRGDVEFRASVSATGINKIAQLIHLIFKGTLTPGTVLFWDEPETGLNPKYIKVVAQFLQTLANAGVQIFVATHDYLLTHYLSLSAEYREQTQAPDMQFFALYKGENGTEIETGNNLTEIQNNVILDEYAGFDDLADELFRKSIRTEHAN